MRFAPYVIALALAASVLPVAAQEIKAAKNGWYKQSFKDIGINFLVDTVSRTCFISQGRAGGISEIRCRGLKRRPEWQAIITWTKAPKERRHN